MPIYGIVADMHGNLEAFKAVLRALEEIKVDRVVCLGDVVGYNANPNECAAVLRERGIPTIAGNHDLIAIRRLGTDRCSNKAAYALRRTRQRLTSETRSFLSTLPPDLVLDDRILLVHGGIRDVQWYMRTPDCIRENARLLQLDRPGVKLCIFGHTHDPALYEVTDDSVEPLPPGSHHRLEKDRTYFVNPGSVDASRKVEPKLAEFAVLNSTTLDLGFHRVAYDDAQAEAKALREGYRIGKIMRWLYRVFRRV